MNFCFSDKIKIVLFIFLCISGIFFWRAYNQTILTASSQTTLCNEIAFSLNWPAFVKPNQATSYTIHTNSILDNEANIEFELWQDGKVLTSESSREFKTTFTQPGSYMLKTILRRNENCIYKHEHTITVAEQIWLWIGLEEKDNTFLTRTIQQQWIGFAWLPGLEETLNEETTARWVQQIAQILPISDILFVESSQASALFDHIDDMRTYGIGFPERIILVGKMNQSVLRRLLNQSTVIKDFSEIALIPSPYVSSLAQHIINKQPLETLDVARVINTKQATNTRWMPLWKVIDSLLKNKISLSFLLIILCIPFIVLCLVFLKQVIWINIWTIYYVLLLSGGWLFFGWQIAVSMFVAALFWQIITQTITKKVYILFAPKMWLSIILTCLLYLLITFGIHYFTNQNLIIPTKPESVFFPLLAFSMMMQYIYPQNNSRNDRTRREGFLLLIFWIGITTLLLQQKWLQQIMLWYPDLLWLIIGWIFYVWRYSGLQLTEYLRFWPLVKKYLEEEEE